MTELTDMNRPLRVLDKVLQGGLGGGNLGIVISRHGTGKVAVMTSITIDHAMAGINTMHVALGKTVSDIRAYDDEVLGELIKSLDVQDRADVMTTVERHKQIYTYRDGEFSVERLRGAVEFAATRAEFKPALIELQGWPEFETVSLEEMQALKELATEFSCEIWCSAHTHLDQKGLDDRGVPDYVARFDEMLSVIVALEPRDRHVDMRFVKTHGATPPQGVHLEFDPQTMLIRWR